MCFALGPLLKAERGELEGLIASAIEEMMNVDSVAERIDASEGIERF